MFAHGLRGLFVRPCDFFVIRVWHCNFEHTARTRIARGVNKLFSYIYSHLITRHATSPGVA